MSWKDSETFKIVEYLGGQIKRTKAPINVKKVLEQYKTASRSSSSSLEMRKKLSEKITKDQSYLSTFDTETKVRFLYMLKVPIGEPLLQELRQNADVELDSFFRISKYISHEKRGLRVGNHLDKPSKEESEPIEKMLNFLAKFAEKQQTPVSNDTLAEEYKTFTGVNFQYRMLSERFRTVVKPAIQTSKQFDVMTRVRMLFVSKTPIGESLLSRINNRATVELGDNNRILSIKEYDGISSVKKNKQSTSNNNNKNRSGSSSMPREGVVKRMRVEDGNNNVNRAPKPPTKASAEPPSKRSCFAFRTGFVHESSEEEDSEDEDSDDDTSASNNSDNIKREVFDEDEIKQDDPGSLRSVPPSTVGSDSTAVTDSFRRQFSAFLANMPKEDEAADGVERTSIKEFLKLLRGLVLTIESPFLTPIGEKIKNTINVMGDNKIPLDNVLLSLKTFYRLIAQKASRIEDQETSCPFPQLLTLLYSVVNSLDSPKAAELKEMIKEESKQLETDDDKVPLKYIDMALQTTLALCTPRFFNI